MPRIAAALAVFLTVVTCIGFNTARYPVVWEMVAARDSLSQSREPDEPAASSQTAVPPQSASFAETYPEADSTAFWESNAESAATRTWEAATVEPISAYPIDPAERSSPGSAEGAPIAVDNYAPIDSVAMREPPAGTGGAFDPVAPGDAASRPTERPDTSGAGEDPIFRSAHAAEETAASRVEEPVEASTAKKYASSPQLGAGLPASPSRAGSGHPRTAQKADTAWNGDPDAEAALVPVKPPNAGEDFFSARDAESSSAVSAVAGNRSGTSNTKRLPPVDVVSFAPGADRRPPRPGDSIPIYPTTGVR